MQRWVSLVILSSSLAWAQARPPRAPKPTPARATRAVSFGSARHGSPKAPALPAGCRRHPSLDACNTPLVLVFEEPLFPLRHSRGTFPLVPGVPVASDWPAARTPWLVRDLDGNGRIDDGRELFGSSTRLADGRTARQGFEALAGLDANGDGVLDHSDPAFRSLALWSDRNGDRITDPGELVPLGRLVVSISLRPEVTPSCDASGNCGRERAPMRWRDERGVQREGEVVDLYLKVEDPAGAL